MCLWPGLVVDTRYMVFSNVKNLVTTGRLKARAPAADVDSGDLSES
jgi:hypothetical protein